MNIDELKAGKETDALVAELVMRSPKPITPLDLFCSPLTYTTEGYWYRRFEYNEGDTGEWWPMPFSTNPSFTYKVIERVGCYDVWNISISSEGCSVELVERAIIKGPIKYEGSAEEFPLLICKAALRSWQQHPEWNHV